MHFKGTADISVKYSAPSTVDSQSFVGRPRRHGHNEQDSPHATLPLTYDRIAKHPRVQDIYAERLHARGLTTPELLQGWQVPFCCQAYSIKLHRNAANGHHAVLYSPKAANV